MAATSNQIDQGRMQADSAPALQDDVDDQSFNDQQVAYRSTLPFITPAMHAFAAHWALNRNQIKAYQHAYPGSSANHAKNNASQLFRDQRVQAEIRRVIESWSEKSGITIAQLEHELTRLGRSDVRNLFDEHGNIRPPHEWDADTAAAVSSYTVVETTKGRGEDKYTEVTRKVRLAEKHGPLRTLLEAKGAFEKHKAPPGAAAIFNINLGGQPMQLGVPVEHGRTIDMDAKPAGRGKKSPVRQGQSAKKPEKRSKAVLAHPRGMSKTRQIEHSSPESVEISTVPDQSVTHITEQQHTVEISTPSSKPDLF